MINAQEGSTAPMRSTLRAGIAAILIASSGGALAQTTSDYAVVDGVTIYYAVLPAEMLRNYPPGSEEGRMHGGVPRGRHVHHLQIALFDATTGARITDASVVATVTETGLGGVARALEPFQIGEALTYGGYFQFDTRDLYDIRVRATLPDDGRQIERTFEYRHQ